MNSTKQPRMGQGPEPSWTSTSSTADNNPSLQLEENFNSDYSNPADDKDNNQNQTTAEMPGGRRSGPPKREVDLSLLLNPTQRAELTVLVDSIIDSMQKQLDNPFKHLDTPIAQSQPRVKIWNYPGVQNSEASTSQSTTQMENAKPSEAKGEVKLNGQWDGDNKTKPASKIDVDAVLATNPSMKELHRELTVYFLKWKTIFTKRLNEVVVSNSPAPRHSQGFGRGGAVAGGPSGKQQGNKGKNIQYSAGASSASRFEYSVDKNLIKRFPTTITPLSRLPVDKRRLLLHSMTLLLLSLEHYIGFSRVLLLNLTSSLHIPMYVLVGDEKRIALNLAKVHKSMALEEAAQQKPEDIKDNKPLRKFRPGPGNNAAIGAALVAAGIGSVPGGMGLGAVTTAALLGSLAESELSLGSLFGASVPKPSTKSLEAIASSVQDFAFMPLHGSTQTEYRDGKEIPPEDRRMRVVICVNGFQTDKDDLGSSWMCLGPQNEVFALRWETEPLMKMGGALESLVKSAAWTQTKSELAGRLIMTTINQKTWPTSLMRVSKIIDNPWCVAVVRADKAGAVLAEAIMNKVHGERGVTLVGYGLGARAIWLCLMTLAERRAYGLVDSVVMMGNPSPSDAGTWSVLKSVVQGRLVNVYSTNDYILGFAQRMGCYQFGIAGLQKIEGVGGVENTDVSDLISAHFQYQALAGQILERIEWEDLASAQPPPRTEEKPSTPQIPAAVTTATSLKRQGNVGNVKENTLPSAQMPPTAAKDAAASSKLQGNAKENALPASTGGRNARRKEKAGEKRLAAQVDKMKIK